MTGFRRSALRALRPDRLSARARGLAVQAGWAEYRPVAFDPVDDWDTHYGAGDLDHYKNLAEISRYSLLLGYLTFFGDSPSVLDVGCGAGILVERTRGLGWSRYLGIDPSSAAIEQADRLSDDATTFRVAESPTPDLGQFDFVVCNEMLYCVPDAARLLDTIPAVLKPGGHLLTSIWHHPGDTALHKMLGRRFRLVDAVDVKNVTTGGKSFRVACYEGKAPFSGA